MPAGRLHLRPGRTDSLSDLRLALMELAAVARRQGAGRAPRTARREGRPARKLIRGSVPYIISCVDSLSARLVAVAAWQSTCPRQDFRCRGSGLGLAGAGALLVSAPVQSGWAPDTPCPIGPLVPLAPSAHFRGPSPVAGNHGECPRCPRMPARPVAPRSRTSWPPCCCSIRRGEPVFFATLLREWPPVGPRCWPCWPCWPRRRHPAPGGPWA